MPVHSGPPGKGGSTLRDYVNNNANSEMHYPPASANKDQSKPSAGEDWSLPAEMRDRTKLLKHFREPTAKKTGDQNQGSKPVGASQENKAPTWPLRENFTNDNARSKVITNHFTYNLTVREIYEYKIVGLPENANRRTKKIMVEEAIRSWPFLQRNREHFAVHIDTIVSWRPVHLEIPSGSTQKTTDDFGHVTWSGLTIQDRGKDLQLRFELVQEVNLHGMQQYSLGNPAFEKINFVDLARCLNIVVSKSLNNDVHKQSANKFFVKTARARLGPSISLETIRGYYYTVKPGMGNIILNFNIATSAFFRPILVSELLMDSTTFLSRNEAEASLRKKRVYIEYERHYDDADQMSKLNSEPSRLKQVCGLSEKNIGQLTFQHKKRGDDGKPIKDKETQEFIYEGPHIRVVDHLKTIFGKNVNPNLKAVDVGGKGDPVWYAQEFLRIVPFQMYTDTVPGNLPAFMIKEACRTPTDSRVLIETEGLRSLGLVSRVHGAPSNLGNGVPIQLHTSMLKVTYQNLGFPQVHYNSKQLVKRGSRWNILNRPDFRFVRTGERTFKYVFVKTPAVDRTSPEYYDNLLSEHLGRCGFKKGQAQNLNPAYNAQATKWEDGSMQKLLEQYARLGANLVILVLKTADRNWYRVFKNFADRKFGLQSICIVERLDNRFNFDQYMQNISMKLNLKFGGVNHTAFEQKDGLGSTMILGADLIHPASGSIAAMVGSVDPMGARCLGSVRLQDVQESDHEIIYTVEDMVYERLLHWHRFSQQYKTKNLPDNILYYRDGVDSGHYSKINRIEIEAIYRAYARARKVLGLPPQALKLTAVIVTKRHHTRFYVPPGEKADPFGKGNTHPGTVVDKLVTSPYYQDFFLQSHTGIQGTVKPTHYFVLKNDVATMTLDKIKETTHKLCYSYCRATVGVSYASPTYYADRLCERAALYMREIQPGKIPWTSKGPPKPQPDGKIVRDAGVDRWFSRLEDKYCPRKNDTGVQPWTKWAPWHPSVADTMFWM